MGVFATNSGEKTPAGRGGSHPPQVAFYHFSSYLRRPLRLNLSVTIIAMGLNNVNAGTPAGKKWTSEQLAIIQSSGNIRINAVAGSGKTTTLVEYAAARPPGSTILYLAFNKSVKLEAIRKFSERGLHNVVVETAHSLAYRAILRDHAYSIKANGYKTHEIVELLNLQGNGELHAEFILANHISKFITYFCNSDCRRVQDLNYMDTVQDEKARAFVRSFYKQIEYGTRLLLSRMDKGEIEIIHDFYLKKFQLSKPVLRYDYILFDEGQDASPAMLDVFLNQQATKVIVGDTHQQIYSWRHAVNSLEKATFPLLRLSASFRFPPALASLASETLRLKEKLGEQTPIELTGKGKEKKEKTVATIARTNLGLLLNAITGLTASRKLKHIYFEGNIHSYTYADDGASLYDVLNLYNDQRDRIRDKLIRSMQTMDALEEYIEKTEDVQLGMMLEIVKEYGNEIPGLIKSLKALHTGDEEREKAQMIYSTVHRAKGMEYDVVHLVNDFITAPKLDRAIAEAKKNKVNLDHKKWNEEINLLYVAITRARNLLHIPEALLPENFPASPHILVQKPPEPAPAESPFLRQLRTRKNSTVKESAGRYQRPGSSYQPWSKELDRELKELYESGATIAEIAASFERTRGLIAARLRKLGYLEE